VAPELASSEAQGWLAEMQAIEGQREIVEKWAAFCQNMQPLLQRYQAAYEARHQARHAAYAQVKAGLEAFGIPTESLSDRLCEGPVGWSLDGLACTSCGTALETLYYQAQSAPQEKERMIALDTPPKDSDHPQPEVQLVRLLEAIQTRHIASPEDLTAALEELRAAVQAVLERGRRVILG